MGENINKFRFIVPPILFTSLVLLAHPEIANPEIANNLNLISKNIPSAIVIAVISAIILVFGFIISSIGYFYVNLYSWTITKFEGDEVKNIKKLFPGFNPEFNVDKEGKANFEYAEWIVADAQGEYIRNQIDKRWQMFMANLNSVVAVLLALIFIVLILPISLPLNDWRFIIAVLLLVIFVYNASEAYRSVHGLTKISALNSPRKKNHENNLS